MEMRYEDLDNIVRKEMLKKIEAYDNWIECQTLQDLLAIQFNNNSLHMEGLTIRERILGRKCPEVAHSVVFRFVFFFHYRFEQKLIISLN